MPEDTKPLTAEQRRALRKAQPNPELAAQREADITALDEAEQARGDSNVSAVHIPYSSGLPTLAAVRTPSPNEMSQYRFACKPNKRGEMPDAIGPAETIADHCLIYPNADVFARMCAARPGLKVQLGLAALKLAQGAEEEEGKG